MKTRYSALLILGLLVLAIPQATQADVGLSLNAYFNDPTDNMSGGTWEVVAVSTTPGEGIAGIAVVVDGIDDPAGAVDPGPGINHFDNFIATFHEGAGIFQLGYVQDFIGPIVDDVGLPSFAFAQPDPLGNPAWDDQALIMTGGTFSGAAPVIDPIGAQEATEANTFTSPTTTTSADFATIDGQLSPVVRTNLIPEPASFLMAGIGLAALVMRRGDSCAYLGFCARKTQSHGNLAGATSSPSMLHG